MARAQTLGGSIMEPPGGNMQIVAPFPGKVLAVGESSLPRPGTSVREGQHLLRLAVLPSERDLLSASEDLRARRAAYEVAQSHAERSQQLLLEKAVSEREVQEAQAALTQAEATLRVAEARLALIRGDDVPAEDLAPMAITAPRGGLIKAVHVAAGQTVAAGTLLYEVSDVYRAWVRVPVYAGDVRDYTGQTVAQVQRIGGVADSTTREARLVTGPLSANPDAASVDLFLEVDNRDGAFRPGEKVSVVFSVGTEESSLIVPYSAILYDYQGGTWVYEQVAPQTYTRRRVELKGVVGGEALVGRGLEPDITVVSVGAAELFGTEFGAGK
jgi:RND family efflux transporter MFP subunit